MKLARYLMGAVAVTALLCAPASGLAADGSQKRAKARTLVGKVVGQPYSLTRTKTAVPLLLSKASARRARLASPVGVVVVRKRSVSVRGQRKKLAPTLLRVADRVRARAKVRPNLRRAAYWQITVARFKVTKRARTLSAAELQTLVIGLRRDLDRLTAAVTGLARYTAAGFQALSGQIRALRGELRALGAEFSALKAELDALKASLTSVELRLQQQIGGLAGDVSGMKAQLQGLLTDVASLKAEVVTLTGQLVALQAQVSALSTQLAGLVTTVAGLSTRLDVVEGLLTDVSAGDLADALADIAQLQADLAALEAVLGDSTSGVVKQLNDVSATVGGAGTGLVQLVAALQSADVQTQSDVDALEAVVGDSTSGLVKWVGDLELVVGDSGGGLVQSVAGLQTVVGNSGSGLVQQVNGLQADVDVLCGPASVLNALC